MQRSIIKVVSFPSSAISAELFRMLRQNGHDPVAIDPVKPSRATEDGPLIALVGNGVDINPADEEWLLRWPGEVLGVFCGRAELLNERLLLRCRDFLCWPCAPDELELRLQRLLTGIRREAGSYQDSNLAAINMVGSSPAFLSAVGQIRRIAGCDAPVLIDGETGTGKELAARAIHYFSDRRDYPFVPVNCGALPDSLIENELFGHEKGAYTDAREAAEGLIALANGGTLFLDEIDTLSSKGQVALLRFLQDRQYRSVGGRRLRTADVRLVSASNCNLGAAVRERQFREDLYFRINVLSVTLPPLRERADDVIQLATHFLSSYSAEYRRPGMSLHPKTVSWLRLQGWPGNVRELQSMVLRGFLLTDGNEVALHSSEADDDRRQAPDRRLARFAESFSAGKHRVIAQYERSFIESALRECQGNVSAAARRVGKERRAFGKLLKKYGLDRGLYRVANDPQGG